MSEADKPRDVRIAVGIVPLIIGIIFIIVYIIYATDPLGSTFYYISVFLYIAIFFILIGGVITLISVYLMVKSRTEQKSK